jgi:hypothetical protein
MSSKKKRSVIEWARRKTVYKKKLKFYLFIIGNRIVHLQKKKAWEGGGALGMLSVYLAVNISHSSQSPASERSSKFA